MQKNMPNQAEYNTEEVLSLLKVQQTSPDVYRGDSHFMGSPNLFGGQLLGQSLQAANMSVDNRRPHSMHAMFVASGKHDVPVEYRVERLRDGGSFSLRRVVASQRGRTIFMMTASFQAGEEGFTHYSVMPNHPSPDTLPSNAQPWRNRQNASGQKLVYPAPVDFRSEPEGCSPKDCLPEQKIWARAPFELDDDPSVHESLFAYMSDYGLLWTPVKPHGVAPYDARLRFASLDHTIWFHRPLRMDEWLLFSMHSPSASGGRGLTLTSVHNRAGELVATIAQEGLIRYQQGEAALQ